MKKQASGISRRQALKTLVVGGAAVAASSHVGEAKAESEEVTKEVKGEGYRETDHIRAYYASLQQ
ncbi:twin-arginine translocation signal domain-containing protein [Shewanella corallii]|uniref:Twin-arginine translocation signal domain-containing protein n=2 Tax=Shewanella TaxID=22 RepID=A0ABT0NE39_9GAMM|nr:MULTISPECIES: twin-arginine translocation signal domain-containing protein [Shewanella]MCL1039519.1 twin-arginine translocation signal domain-containing protein [Shewanella submarina]MCL2916111.1 twin-arginine translocation signal domain-containing protein [Shewanella corallii]